MGSGVPSPLWLPKKSGKFIETGMEGFFEKQDARAISTGQLHPSQGFHLQPIDEAEAEQYLSKLTAGEFSPLMYESKATARSEFAQFRQMFLLIGGILCAIIGLVGLLNFFNAMMTGILSRRREFAVLQAVGMTNRQLKTMLIYEGLFYAMSSVAAAFILSLAVGPLAGKMLGSMFWFFEYRFTILPVLLTIPVFLLLGWLIPCMMYDNAAKCSIVDQLRDAQ